MEKNRVAQFCVAASACALTHAFGCGPWFEEAPPTLPFYLHRLPAKTIEEIYQETPPPRTPLRTPSRYVDFPSEIKKLSVEVTPQDAPQLREKIDGWLVIARTRDNVGYWSGGALSNLLFDLRDALSVENVPAAELAEYFKWRVEHADWFGLQTKSGEPEPRPHWYGEQPDVPWDRVAEVDQHAAKAAPALRAHWVYLHGALEFKSGEDLDSQRWFQRVLREFPASPRADAAAFMNARCALSQSRSYNFDRPETNIDSDPEKRAAAVALFAEYRKKYPQGRFAPDAIGWLGALAFDAQDYAQALGYYIQQTEMPNHPELLKPALIMCERVLEHLGAAPNDAAFAEIARTPRVAMAMIYLIVNATEADNFDGKYDDVARVNGWRKNILPRLGHAVAAQKSAYASADWQPRFLAILAQAASGSGSQEEALRLTKNAETTTNDDLLMARGVALQRAARLPEAIQTYELFLKKFARSPLARGAQLRLATALQDDHRAGFAVVELSRLAAATGQSQNADDTEPGYRPAEVSDAEPAQIAQLLDTLLNFAPLTELAAPLGDPNLENDLRLTLSQTLAERHLAHENFAEAKKYMTPTEWSLQAADLEKLTAEAQAAQPGESQARALFALGERWARARRKLLVFPLDSTETRRGVARDFAAIANWQRKENAKALFNNVDADAEMESREELRHAFNYWLKAADEQPASDLAARALWQALAAMPQIADVSPYALQRAVETDAAGLSRQLYERLRGECPGSREARELAVYWNFPDPKRDDGQLTVRRYGEWDERVRASILGGEDEEHYPPVEKWHLLIARMTGLDRLAEKEEALREEVRSLREEARALHKNISEAFLLNFLDDVALFLERPALTAEVRRRYLELRIECLRRSAWEYWDDLHEEAPEGVDLDAKLRDEIHAAQKNPALKRAGEFLDFLDLSVVANHLIEVKVEGVDKDGEPLTYGSRDYALLEKMTDAFLAKFPDSPKREAALLLRARAIFNLSRPVFFKRSVEWPEANRMEGSIPPQFHQREKFNPPRVLGALDDYDRAFPGGQYKPTIRSYRADVLARLHDWPHALELTLGLIEDAHVPELHEEAAVQLAKIFEQLADENQRAPLLKEIKASEALVGFLHTFLKIDSDDHPLLYLKQYLSDQIGVPLRD